METLPAEAALPVVLDPKAVKRANFDAYLANVAAGSLEATNKPVQLFLEVSSRCNLRCKKCGFAYDPSLAKNGRDLAWPILARMDEFFAAAVEVYTFGYGEMFLYPELAPLVTVLKNHGCRVSGVTNGVLIRPADVVWLVATGYDHLAFSIDGATEETMEKLRGASLAKVLHTLRLIHEEKQRRKSELPRIVVNFVAQNDNFRELPDLARLVAPLGIHFFGVNPLHHFFENAGGYGPYYDEFRLSRVPRGDYEAAVDEARSILEAAGVTFANFVNPGFEWPPEAPTAESPVALHNHPRPEAEAPVAHAGAEPEASAAGEPAPPVGPSGGLSPMYCHYPWTTLYLSASGKARVCCFMSVREDLGEFTGESSVGTAWNGPALQSVRAHIREGRVHPACAECVKHRSYEIHAAAMNPIRAELDAWAAAAASPPPSAQPPPPTPGDPGEDEGVLRRFIRRWRAPEGEGAGRPA